MRRCDVAHAPERAAMSAESTHAPDVARGDADRRRDLRPVRAGVAGRRARAGRLSRRGAGRIAGGICCRSSRRSNCSIDATSAGGDVSFDELVAAASRRSPTSCGSAPTELEAVVGGGPDEAARRRRARPRSALSDVVLASVRQPQGLHIRCPHCASPVELLADTPRRGRDVPRLRQHVLPGRSRRARRRRRPALQSIGRFELISRLGVGGFGTVWKARDPELDRIGRAQNSAPGPAAGRRGRLLLSRSPRRRPAAASAHCGGVRDRPRRRHGVHRQRLRPRRHAVGVDEDAEAERARSPPSCARWSPRRSTTPTSAASCIATSSRRTS